MIWYFFIKLLIKRGHYFECISKESVYAKHTISDRRQSQGKWGIKYIVTQEIYVTDILSVLLHE